jgi:hypothetical protein
MELMPVYDPQFKEQIVKKMMPPHNQSVAKISRDTGVAVPTLYSWKKLFCNQGFVVPAKSSRPDDWDFYQSEPGRQVIGKKSLYLLRNADTKSKGLGFALAGNFYPDYLLWLVDDETGEQCLNFIDPKGIRQMNLTDPKLGLYKEVKVLQEKLADPKLTLNAFILSGTPFDSLINVTCKKSDLEDRHVLFMNEGGSAYLSKMFSKISR